MKKKSEEIPKWLFYTIEIILIAGVMYELAEISFYPSKNVAERLDDLEVSRLQLIELKVESTSNEARINNLEEKLLLISISNHGNVGHR